MIALVVGPFGPGLALKIKAGLAIMTIQNDAERMLELEESAEGADLFRAPGAQLQVEKARDQAEASGWIPERDKSSLMPSHRLQTPRARREELHTSMELLESTIARPSAAKGWQAAVEAALADLGDALRAHIHEVEAPDGLLAEILDVSPRLASDIEVIKKDHVELMSAWERAYRTSMTEAENVTGLRRRVVALLGRLAVHRHRGSDLVYEAYNVDIAAGD
jgi:hypothetical protein